MNIPRPPCDIYDSFLTSILPGIKPYDFRNKKTCVNDFVRYMLNRTSQIFEWSGLPETIPQRTLELYLQCNGSVCIYKYNNNLYPFVGGFGGEPNPYYMPTIYTIANPALRLSVTAKIGEDCIIIPSDTMYLGLLPMLEKYATMLTETELSLYVNLINARVPALISADNASTADSAEHLLKDVESGKLGIASSPAFFDGLKTAPYTANASHTLTDILEIEQYLRATLYNEIGLQSNYNMKRERLTDDETALNEMTLLPLIDDMLQYRKQGALDINAKWGTNITVKLKSAWKLTTESAHTENGENIKTGGEDDATSDNN